MKRVIIIGAGASVQEGLNEDLWRKIEYNTIWSCNYAFMTMPYRPARELWVDRSFFKNNVTQLCQLQKEGIELVAKENASSIRLPGTTYYIGVRKKEEYVGKEGIAQNKIFIGAQGFSGTFALHVAICEGYNEIFLLGFDYGVPPSSGETITHYYQNKLNVISSGVGMPNVYLKKDKVKQQIDTYDIFLQETDIKIWNVSPKSNIQCFDKITYEEFFNKIKAP